MKATNGSAAEPSADLNGVERKSVEGKDSSPTDADKATKANDQSKAAMTGERTKEADSDEELKRGSSDATNGVNVDKGMPTTNDGDANTNGDNKQHPSKLDSLMQEGSESTTCDYFETFKGFLRGEKNVEKVRKRLASPKERESKQGETLSSSSSAVTEDSSKPNGCSNRHVVSKFVPKQPAVGDANLSLRVLPQNSIIFIAARSILLDIPLMVLFACFVTSWIVKGVHQHFFEPLFFRAVRTDEDLVDEFTYYERQCNALDLTTRDMKDMLIENETSIDESVEIMMTHGLSVIPEVLQPDTVMALREYIVYRNNNIPEDEEYPMTNGYKRISYGIEATEHPAVTTALKEVANHPVMRPLMAALLGDEDPASSEITAITNFPGCRLQVWHQDTKQDGNALKFARTYSHSYSLFLPLQDITARMGATDVCPGTHYCANDLESLCEKASVGLNEVTEGNVLPGGAGALLNQHVWHRGGAHTDFDAPDRIVFIVSFLARPNFGVDPRQLSRGTYFHQKWNMWGHTWTDLTDPAKRMRFPFSVLRCLSLWKPFDSNWGYDLITSGFMRFANEQLEEEDFYHRFLPKLKQIHFPNFLKGKVVAGTQLDLWSTFIRSTIEKVNEFFSYVILVSYILYFVIGAGYNFFSGRPVRTWIPNSLKRLLYASCLLAALGARIWFNIQNSSWGKHISSGRALMRPFPPPWSASFAERTLVSKGPTTMPTRWDVLIGTRFSAEFLGSYRRWLDFHPGNLAYQSAIHDVADSFEYFESMEPKVQSGIVKWVMNQIHQNEGRFLVQDFISGDWRLLPEEEAFREVAVALNTAKNPLIADYASKLDVMIDDRRFGPTRGTPMGSLTHLLLWDIRQSLLFSLPPSLSSQKQLARKGHPFTRTSLQLGKLPLLRALSYYERNHSLFPFATKEQDDLQVGSLVWARFSEEDGGWMPGSILDFDAAKEWYLFAGDDSQMDSSVYFRNLKKMKPLVEGDPIMGCFHEGLKNCYPGTITRVHPGGSVSIFFDDGEFEYLMPPSFYYQPPFRHEGPFPV